MDPDTPLHEAYRSVAAARPARADDVSEDRVRIARLDDGDFDTLRSLLSRLARVERALVPSAAGLAAARTDDALVFSAVAANHAAGVDSLLDYWERVVDGEEHARGNDVTGLGDDRWLGDAHLALDRLPAADDPDDPDGPAALGGYLVGEALVARGLSGVLAATVDGGVEGLPVLPGLAANVDGLRAALTEHAAAVAVVAPDLDGESLSVDDPDAVLRDALPSVAPGVPVDEIVAESVGAYRSVVGGASTGTATREGEDDGS